MVDSIKITALQDIGANIAYTTLVPLVNMAGTPTTQKANLQNLGNLILNGAGGSYFARAAQANLALSVANAAQPNITSVGTLTSLVVTGNIISGNANLGNIATANFFYGNAIVTGTANLGAVGNVTITGGTNGQVLTTNGTGGLSWTTVSGGSSYGNSNVAAYLPTFTGTVGANRISSNNASGSNLQINANGAVFTFGQGGALYWPAPSGNQWVIEPNIDNEFEIRSTSNVIISTDTSNVNAHFTFDSDGIFTAPSNVNLLGSRLNVGPEAANIANLASPTLIIANSAAEFIQAAIININSNGSADWIAQGADSDDEQGYSDLGFTGHSFNDPNFTITAPGDGYVFSQGYANGIGGSLVLATGENGNVNDIVFATGGFLANAEFARIDHANNMFHLTRANSGIQFDDGSIQTTAYTGGAGTELVNGDNSFVLDSAGNVVFEGDGANNAVNRGMVWAYGAGANGVNSQVRQDNAGLTVRAWTENGGGANGYSAPVNIVTNQDAATSTWTFDGQGNLRLPGNIIAINDSGQLGAQVVLEPDLGQARIAGRSAEYTQNFNSGGWTSAEYTGTQVDITDDPNLLNFVSNNTTFTTSVNPTFSINGGEPVPYQSYGASGNNVTLYTNIAADPDPTTVTSIDFYYQQESSIGVDYDDGSLNIAAAGLTIYIDNDQTQGPDINIRSGDDITIQAKDKALGTESEGGDINIYAGDGADDDGAGNTASTGGDIQITAGNGGDGNSSTGSAGGFTQIRGGSGGYAGVTNTAGPGGYVEIIGGSGGGYGGGNAELGAGGGYVSITAGSSTQEGVNGANVTITSGDAGPNALAGSVSITTPLSADGPGGTWTFDGYGNLTLPEGGIVHETAIPFGGLEGNTIALKPAGGTNADQQLLVYPTAGQDFNHLHLTSGNLYNTELFLGDDNFNVKLANTGNIVITTNDNTGNVGTWTFGVDSNLTLPQLTTISDESGIGATLTVGAPPTVIVISGADFTAVNTTYTKTSAATPTWEPAGYNPATDPYIEFSGGQFGIFAPSFGQALYVNTGTLNKPLTQWSVNPPLGSIAPTGVYTYGASGPDWVFGDDGLLTLPGGNVVIGSVLGGEAILASNTPFGVVSQGNGSTVLQWIDDIANATALSAIYINSPSGNTGDVAVLTGEPGANANIWTFGADGILTVPGNLVAVSASPAPVISGFSSVSALQFTNGNSNVTVNANSNLWNFDSTGNLIIPGSSGGFIKTVSNASIGIAAVDNGTNNPAQLLSLNSGSGAATSIVSAYSTNVAIQTNAAGAINTWSFSADGNLTLPGNTVAIKFANNSSAFGNMVQWTTAPLANTSAGTAGQAAYDAGGNLYVCVAANTWSKFAGTTSW